MFWECRGAIWSEYLPDGFSPFFSKLHVRAENEKWEWNSVVSQYSKANLTYGSDKLPTLSGIADRQRRITRDTYLAGMWRHDLHLQLHWRVGASTQKPRPDWRAPTWTWMSTDSPVIFPYDDGRDLKENQVLIHVLDAWTSPIEPDGLGAVSGGQITLLCVGLVDAEVLYGDSAVPDTAVIKANQKSLHITMGLPSAHSKRIRGSACLLVADYSRREGRRIRH